ncbi:GNAT family N-acetyltransferase [Haliangium ochraceum]|uniref:GCN5-related N-acetyltransferase n=1 Tax=Haliangium ochraceum (strain DSM 14365 / JCM 11303 / SMP-2) TaxID=502025 RepID=D0LUQ3_HALO1|nr:GNAT family N-acetyltransferase [Haliangium ochraceum]ACY13943.1 GCN5-related N-acetyltransferase [Haliangium ochraceum DSM 14365]
MLRFHRVIVDSEPRLFSEVMSVVREESERSDCRMVVQPVEFYRRFQGDAGAIFVAYDGERVVGFSLLARAPRINAIWSPYIEELRADRAVCGVLVQNLVRTGYRGCGIGRALARLRIEYAEARGVRHLFATVEPSNAASLAVMTNAGFYELERKLVYEEQVPRVLFHRASRSPTGRAVRASRPSA